MIKEGSLFISRHDEIGWNINEVQKELIAKNYTFQDEPGGEHSSDSRYGLKINGGISPGFENLISRLAVIEDDKDTPIFGDTTPPSSSIPRAGQITPPYDSQPRLPFFLPRFGRIRSSSKHTASWYNNDLTRDINRVLITDPAKNWWVSQFEYVDYEYHVEKCLLCIWF